MPITFSTNGIEEIITAAIAIVSSTGFWKKFQNKAQTFTNFFNAVDKGVNDVNNAVQNPQITDAQFQAIWNDYMQTHLTAKALVTGQSQ